MSTHISKETFKFFTAIEKNNNKPNKQPPRRKAVHAMLHRQRQHGKAAGCVRVVHHGNRIPVRITRTAR